MYATDKYSKSETQRTTRIVMKLGNSSYLL